jgi:hypothetical protein
MMTGRLWRPPTSCPLLAESVSSVLAVVLWPLVLLGVNLHLK